MCHSLVLVVKTMRDDTCGSVFFKSKIFILLEPFYFTKSPFPILYYTNMVKKWFLSVQQEGFAFFWAAGRRLLCVAGGRGDRKC